MTTPQIIVSLSANGDLIAELPGLNGSRRKINLKHTEHKETESQALRRILQSLLVSKSQLGEDGSPTQHQIRHWENHGEWKYNEKTNRFGVFPQNSFSDPSCTFCQSEGRFDSGKNREKSLKNLSLHEAIKLGLISRGYKATKINPELFLLGKMSALIISNKVQDKQKVFWSKSQLDKLILDGKQHASAINFSPAEYLQKSIKLGSGASVKKTITKATTKKSSSPLANVKLSDLSF